MIDSPQKIMKLRPTFTEDLKAVIEQFTIKNQKWNFLSAEDETSEYKKMFTDTVLSMFHKKAVFNDIHSVYWTIELPHQIHAVFEEHVLNIVFNPEDKSESWKKSEESSEESLLRNSFILYFCDRPACIEDEILNLGMRFSTIKWNKLFRGVPYGISEIETHFLASFLEDPNRLPLMLKIIQAVSQVPCFEPD